MTKKEKLSLLESWENVHKGLEKAFKLVDRAFGCVTEGPLFEAVWDGFEEYTETLAKLLKVDPEWLHWYCYDNLMGLNGLKAGPTGAMREIRTIEDLVWLIEKEDNQ